MELVKNRVAPKSGIPTSGLGVLVGYPKGGKTTLAASFPDSYVLELEPGGGDRVDGRIHDIKTLAELRNLLPLLMKESAIKTIVIDTVDVLSGWMENEIAAEVGLEAITDRKEGVNGFELWGKFKTRMEKLTTYLKASGKLALLIAHTRDAKTNEDGQVISPAGINVPGKSGSFIAAQADFIGFVSKKELGSGLVYSVSFKGGPLGTWGSRIKEINGKTIVLSEKNPYQSFADAFKVSGNGKTAAAPTLKTAPKAGKKKAKTKGRG